MLWFSPQILQVAARHKAGFFNEISPQLRMRDGPGSATVVAMELNSLDATSDFDGNSLFNGSLAALEAQNLPHWRMVAETLPLGLLCFDGSLGVVWCNQMASRLLLRPTGCGLVAGHLRVWQSDDQQRLQQCLNGAFLNQHARPGKMILRRKDSPYPLVGTVYRLQTGNQAGSAHFALLALHDSGQRLANTRHLVDIYALTREEEKLALALLNNATVEQHAMACAVKLSTTRTHLSSLFKKTGTSRQAELVRQLMLMLPSI